VTKRTPPPVDPEVVRSLPRPSAYDRNRIRENIDRAVSRGAASQTVLRVDASMAERALGATSSAALYGSKLALAKLLIPAVLIGAGVGAIWARTLFAPHAQPEPASPSLPVQVEDLNDDDLPPGTTLAPQAAWNEPLVFGAPQPAASSPKPAHHLKQHHAASRAADPHLARPTPAAASEPTPAVAEAEQSPAPEAPSHHLAEELRLMRAASAALSKNDIPRTLNLLADHAERFPDGALREERRALRVISLCKQGRSHFALVERDEFLSSSPRSPLTARVREACELSK
jgi:hypothetical protein